MALASPEVSQGVIITDCSDENARARLQLRFNSLFGIQPVFIGLEGSDADLTAAGHLVDMIDAAQTPSTFAQPRTVIQLNVAPRGTEEKERWENGTPFCYAELNNGRTTVVSTYEGRTLSLVNKLGLLGVVNLLHIPDVANTLVNQGIITNKEAKNLKNTQFRSLVFQPLVARLLVDGIKLPSDRVSLTKSEPIGGKVWFVDIFGNLKTTILPEEVGFEEGKIIELASGHKIACYTRLADVPTGELGLTIGSSGFGEARLIEIALQKGRATDETGLTVGSSVI